MNVLTSQQEPCNPDNKAEINEDASFTVTEKSHNS